MKVISYIVATLFLCLYSCSSRDVAFTSNHQLISVLDMYLSSVDSSDLFNPSERYIYLSVKNRSRDTIYVILSTSAGAYSIVNPHDSIIAFFEYKKHRVMLVGDYPNNLTCIKKDFDENAKKEVLTKYFKDEYKLYLKEPFSLKPKMADPMFMKLVFKDSIMVSITER